LLDSNLMLLLLIGRFDTGLLGKTGFKRTVQFIPEDFRLLVKFLALFRQRVTTAHILTEVSNLAGKLPEHRKIDCFGTFVTTLEQFHEQACSSMASARREDFCQIGLTDAVVSDFAPEYLVLSDDRRLCARLNESGIDALNFNHIRTLNWA